LRALFFFILVRPACAQSHQSTQVASTHATDYATGKIIEAAQAFYVEDSDVHHCDPQRMMRNETGGIYTMDWHRCDPSLIAFGSRQAAAVFQTQHGGRVMSFVEAEDAVKAH